MECDVCPSVDDGSDAGDNCDAAMVDDLECDDTLAAFSIVLPGSDDVAIEMVEYPSRAWVAYLADSDVPCGDEIEYSAVTDWAVVSC